jgi:hypothetical protein
VGRLKHAGLARVVGQGNEFGTGALKEYLALNGVDAGHFAPALKFDQGAAAVLKWCKGKLDGDFPLGLGIRVRVGNVFKHLAEFSLEHFAHAAATNVSQVEGFAVRNHLASFLGEQEKGNCENQ